jgi:hypothetical protein
MDPSRFDHLVRSLTESASRRRTLGVLAGGALAVLAAGGVSEATAKRKHKQHGRAAGGNGHGGPGGNSDCAHFCAAVFGADTPAAGQCTSDAARGDATGLCGTCGTAAPTDICCVRNSAGFCTDAAAVCPCGTGQTCVGGQCQSSGCETGGTCANFTSCGSGCGCGSNTEGGTTCFFGHIFCSGLTACTSSAACGTGNVCITNTCCSFSGRCFPLCSAQTRAATRTTRRRGRTAMGRS